MAQKTNQRPTIGAFQARKDFLLNQFLSEKNPKNSLAKAKKNLKFFARSRTLASPSPVSCANQNLSPLLTLEGTDRPLGDLCEGHWPSNWVHAGRRLVDRTTRRRWNINSRKHEKITGGENWPTNFSGQRCSWPTHCSLENNTFLINALSG